LERASAAEPPDLSAVADALTDKRFPSHQRCVSDRLGANRIAASDEFRCRLLRRRNDAVLRAEIWLRSPRHGAGRRPHPATRR